MTRKYKKEIITIERKTLRNIVHGCLKDTVHAHGDISPKFFGSVIKRFDSNIVRYIGEENEDG